MLELALREAIERFSPSEQIKQMLIYCVMDGGKRIRPTLALLTMDMLGGDAKRVMPYAVALELIHSYSLVHDDLPAMDNDDYRRGKPSCHKQFGEAMAILAGDALLTMAARVLFEVDGEQEAKKEIFDAAMVMVDGQAMDLCSKVGDELYRKKTGALINAGILAAARLARCSIEQYNALKTYGDSLGLLFQLTDDILDNQQDKATAEIRIKQLCDDGLSSLNCFSQRADKLRELMLSISVRCE